MRVLSGPGAVVLLSFLCLAPSVARSEERQVLVLDGGLEVPVAGPVEEAEGLVLFRTPDGTLRSIDADRVREVAVRSAEPVAAPRLTEPSPARTFTNEDLYGPVAGPPPPTRVIPQGGRADLHRSEITLPPGRMPLFRQARETSELEAARREVYRLMRQYDDPDGAGRVNRVNRINRVNRVTTRPPTGLAAYTLRELQKARARLERLEKEVARRRGK